MRTDHETCNVQDRLQEKERTFSVIYRNFLVYQRLSPNHTLTKGSAKVSLLQLANPIYPSRIPIRIQGALNFFVYYKIKPL